MNKKILLGIILGITCLTIILIVVFKIKIKYNKLIISEDKWNSIINNRDLSTNISLENIKFNDYELIIDNDNNVIYYSIVDSSNKYNPSISYNTNKKVKIVVNDNMSNDKLDKTDDLKIMIYNDKEYRIYSLVITNYPTLNVIYENSDDIKNKAIIKLELFDNHVDSPQRIIKSDGKFRVIEKDKKYSFSLFKQSLGNNKRENHISIFGMEKKDEYIITKVDNTDNHEKYVLVFINNKNIGLYSFGPKEKEVNRFERNKENNK